MKKQLLVLASLLIVASMILAACGTPTVAPEPTKPAEQPAGETPVAPEATAAPTEVPPTPTLTPYPIAECQAGKICIRWFVGLGTGTDVAQIAMQEEVVADFNASQSEIQLILEIIPHASGRDTLSTEIASGNGPDLVGPVGWAGSNDYFGQWLDIAPYLESTNFDTSIFDPALIKFYQVEGQGQVGLPFAVFPGGIFFVPAMFDEAGLAYPPQKYGDKYMLDGQEVDWTWDVVTEVAKRLTVDANGVAANEAGFDATKIVQVGYNPQWQSGMSIATFYGGAAKIYGGDAVGSFTSTIPDSWKAGWKWYYDGMWGAQPFIANGPLAGSAEFGGGNVFNAGKTAMGLTQTWYTCCLGNFVENGGEFQIGIQPMGSDGLVHGRVDADTFRIWKGTKNPEAAVKVLEYLVTTGADKLLPVYGAMPAEATKTQAFFDALKAKYPFVTDASWQVFQQGLAYPDAPSAEQYLPNPIKANARIATFIDLMNNTAPDKFDFEKEYQQLVDDLNTIYNEK